MTTDTTTAETRRRRSVLALVCVAVLVLVVTACQSGSNHGDNDNGAGGAPGAPGGDGNGSEAVGAPIKIPSITDRQGDPVAVIKAELTEYFLEQCGGEMCITLTVEESEPDREACRFVRTRPPPGTEVERGGKVVIVAGTLPCEDESAPGEEEPPPEDGLPTDGGEVPETDEPGTS